MTLMGLCVRYLELAFVTIILSGTFSIEHKRLLPLTMYRVVTATMIVLNANEAERLLRNEIKAALPAKATGDGPQGTDRITLLRKENEHLLRALLSYVGPQPRPLELAYKVLLSTVDKEASLENVTNMVRERILDQYGGGYEATIPDRELLQDVLFLVLTRAKFGSEPEGTGSESLLSKKTQAIQNLADEGRLLLDSENRVMMPLVFMEKYLQSVRLDFWKKYFTGNIPVQLESVVLERFALDFYTEKRRLFISSGIERTTFGEFFAGAYMKPELASKDLLLGNSASKQFDSKNVTVSDFKSVLVAGNPPIKVDLTKEEAFSLFIGKQDSACDSSIGFPRDVVKSETKALNSDNLQVALSGDSKNSFESEQTKALADGFPGRETYFLFVTNNPMSEAKADDVVKPNSMFINFSRWEEAFSSLFLFQRVLRGKARTTKITEEQKGTGQAKSMEKKRKADQDQDQDHQGQEDLSESKTGTKKPRAKKSPAKKMGK